MFAAYTSKDWTSNESLVEDEKAKLISVDNPELVFPTLEKSKAVKHSKSCGPNFGSDCIVLWDDARLTCLSKGQGRSGDLYQITRDNGISQLSGESKALFELSECEVFAL